MRWIAGRLETGMSVTKRAAGKAWRDLAEARRLAMGDEPNIVD